MKYSIITINFNNRVGLKKTIESVVNQTFQDFEYIIIDGGSTDGSVDIIKEYSSRISYWVSEPDKGIYNAMNKGIAQAHGDYINFMNSGDYYYNNRVLSDVVSIHTDADFFVGRVYNVNSDGAILSSSIVSDNLSMKWFYINTIPHQSTFIKRELFNRSKYDENLKVVSDWKFFMERIVFEGCSVFKDDSFFVACCEERGASNDRELLNEEKTKVLRDALPIGIRRDYEVIAPIGGELLGLFGSLNRNKIISRIFLNVLRLLKLLKII